MKTTTLRSIGAVLLGFITGAILSVATDLAFEKMGIMNMTSFKDNPWWIILTVIFYRFLFNITGCYVAARLAPHNPMRHAMIIGVVGTILGIIGSIIMWDQAVAWYNISIILISIPSAWIGATISMIQNANAKKGI